MVLSGAIIQQAGKCFFSLSCPVRTERKQPFFLKAGAAGGVPFL